MATRAEAIPGVSTVCKKCTYKLAADYPSVKYPCGATYFTDRKGVCTPPEITLDPDKILYTCSRYNPNLIARLSNLVFRVSPMLRAIQSSLPQ